jgi:hypothetical protein
MRTVVMGVYFIAITTLFIAILIESTHKTAAIVLLSITGAVVIFSWLYFIHKVFQRSYLRQSNIFDRG